MIEMVVFDMAGTTVDEQNAVYKTLRKVVNEAGLDISQEEVNRVGAGKEKRQAIQDILVAGKAGNLLIQTETLFARFLDLLAETYATLEVKPMPGAEEIFSFLRKKGIKVVLNTGYNRETAEGLIAKLNWKEGTTFDTLVTASDVERSRPHPDMITHAQSLLGVENPFLVLKIGDSMIDIEEGKNADCGITIGITTGAQPKEMLTQAEPDFIVDSLLELKKIVT